MSGPSGPRLFVAAETPEELTRAFAAVRPRLASALPTARWSRPEAIHLTLKFLGATPDARIAPIVSGLRRAATGVKPLDLASGAAGLFENRGRPRVLWLSLEGDLAAVTGLQSAVEAATEPLGFPRETRPFHPHLTLARFDPERRAAIPPGLLDSLDASFAGIAFPVGAIVLFESVLSPGGSNYLPREVFPLGSDGA